MAERVDGLAEDLAARFGWYETAGILSDAAAALRSMEGKS